MNYPQEGIRSLLYRSPPHRHVTTAGRPSCEEDAARRRQEALSCSRAFKQTGGLIAQAATEAMHTTQPAIRSFAEKAESMARVSSWAPLSSMDEQALMEARLDAYRRRAARQPVHSTTMNWRDDKLKDLLQTAKNIKARGADHPQLVKMRRQNEAQQRFQAELAKAPAKFRRGPHGT
eukprot:TRINITY_DN69489_c0_g1_i1.p1 TRINITY_DN69489_c0_g1~~TRINITY_DN69489_c0_g1_i1.p1  ORF type:complete len:177 (+),score=39.00 TRINITY_DN69489_c0_g1_i1:90-620(+)